MKTAIGYLAGLFLTGLLGAAQAAPAPAPNKVAGTWRMVSADIERQGQRSPAYGPKPSAMLVFTEDMHVIEVMTDSTVPRFASGTRGMGTDEENKAAMAGSIGWFGTYTVDEHGDLDGDIVEGSTFPNWVGDVRTREQLNLVVEGDRMTESFTRPEGSRVFIVWQRAATRH